MRSIAVGLSGILFVAACGDNKTIEVSLGGTVQGLQGSGLVLKAGDDEIAVAANGTFAFPSGVAQGKPYAVSIVAQPSSPTQACAVLSASGMAQDRDITNIRVRCTTTPFSIGGTITGLAGEGLVLLNNGEELEVTADGAFEFTKPTLSGKDFAVTIRRQPTGPWQTCEVAGGTGTVASGAVTSVVVNCATDRFTVGGHVNGLAGTLRLKNGGDEVMLTANGTYAFATTVESGQRYEITIAEQPSSPSQTCVISHGDGMVTDGNVESIEIACTTNAFAVGGTVDGLRGAGLVLQNNLANDTPIAADGPFAFTTEILSGEPYAVTVLAQPSNPTQQCDVTGGSGTMGGAPIDATVTCVTRSFTVGGTVSGLDAGESVEVHNGSDVEIVTADGTFTFATAVASGQTYAVTVTNGPAGKTCSIAHGTGTVGGAPVTNVAIDCSTVLTNTAPTPTNLNDKRCDGAISLAVEATENVTITRLDAHLDPLSATNVKFAIFERDTSTLVYASAPVAVSPGLQFVPSPEFSFAMTPGKRYHFAAMVEGCAYFPWSQSPKTENGIRTFGANGNPTSYAAPQGPYECCSVTPGFKIYGTHAPN